LLVNLGPAVVSAGFFVDDYPRVIAELAPVIAAPDISERAVPKRRAEFLAGRFAARQALRALGIEATPGRDAHGRPVWPASVAGSITHGAGRALCAVAATSAARSLGIDAERLMGEATKDELMARICNQAERRALAQSVPVPEPARVTVAFSAKESLYKCLFPLIGRFMDFDAAHVVDARVQELGGGLAGELTLELSIDWSDELRRGRTFRAPFVVSAHHVESGVVLEP
jgi:enterobactin synthetase component D